MLNLSEESNVRKEPFDSIIFFCRLWGAGTDVIRQPRSPREVAGDGMLR